VAKSVTEVNVSIDLSVMMTEQSVKLAVQIERHFLKRFRIGQKRQINLGNVGSVRIRSVRNKQIFQQTQLFRQNVNLLN
jgi:hypothetical protein